MGINTKILSPQDNVVKRRREVPDANDSRTNCLVQLFICDLWVQVQQIQEEEKQARSVTRVNSRFSVTSSSPGKPESNVPIHERLSRPNQKQSLNNVMALLKDELEMQDCTFKPTIPKYTNGGSSHDKSPIFERLNAEAEQMKVVAAKREKLRLLEEMKAFTFQPEIPTYSQGDKIRNRDSTPIHERLNAEAEALKKQHVRRVEERHKVEDEGLTFKPQIKPHRSADKKRVPGDVVDRLNAEAQKVRERKASLHAATHTEKSKELTFTPTLNTKSLKATRSFLWWNDDPNSLNDSISGPSTAGKLNRTFSIHSPAHPNQASASTPSSTDKRRSSSASRVGGASASMGTSNQRQSTPSREEGARGRTATRGATGATPSSAHKNTNASSGATPPRHSQIPPSPSQHHQSNGVATPQMMKRSSSASRIPVSSGKGASMIAALTSPGKSQGENVARLAAAGATRGLRTGGGRSPITVEPETIRADSGDMSDTTPWDENKNNGGNNAVVGDAGDSVDYNQVYKQDRHGGRQQAARELGVDDLDDILALGDEVYSGL
jgi:hypothetical protein